ncbi:MAG TPA: peptidoglycan DD-metalloendopeptidase family protein [Gemmatimonadaceae bacterium]|jgi:septal ring factor EnvC (AmiA/AmiB activator)|nr:peptidoglycan DD-metalloendopeptidase family protein [Gemmatimonadaceae bacterium]
MTRRVRAWFVAALLLLATTVVGAEPAQAQQTAEQKVRAQRVELERIRDERAALEAKLEELRGTLHDLNEEVTNLDSQAEATARAVRSLDAQLGAIGEEVGQATTDLVRAEDELAIKRAVLRTRLADIYKRGPLYSYEALLSAETFAGLVARYKYLHLLALRDRALVKRVEELRNQIDRQRGLMVRLRNDIESSRTEKSREELRLRTLEQQRTLSLAQTKRSATQTAARIKRIERDETRLTGVIAALESARRRAEDAARARGTARPVAPAVRREATLDWPVDGSLLYRFGRVVNPNNTTTRWNGIGIGAPAGTPVKAIGAGEVMVAETFGTYGLTVIVQQSGGDYSVYGSLSSIAVRKGGIVSRGQIIGAVGTADPELPSHLHFEFRPEGRAVDPLDYLRARP